MKKVIIIVLLLISYFDVIYAQDTLKVLFLGNSYTGYNGLPSMVKKLSYTKGKKIFIDSNTLYGQSLSDHIVNQKSLSKIRKGCWDFVILQDFSLNPVIDYYTKNKMYPDISFLKTTIEKYNPCTKIITYMTWGRRFGGIQCLENNCSVSFKDFKQMQDSITNTYLRISNLLKVQCAPVGVTWKNILNESTNSLHTEDNSHPNIDGSYVAALTIFSSIWKVPTSGVEYYAGILPEKAKYYQQISDKTVFENSEKWNLYISKPIVNFNYNAIQNLVSFTNLTNSISNDCLTFNWDFGDGYKSNLKNPIHTYESKGSYIVKLISKDCNFTESSSSILEIGLNHVNYSKKKSLIIYQDHKNTKNVYIDYRDMSNFNNKLIISDLSGKVVFAKAIQEKTEVLNLDDIVGNGLYIFQLIDSNNNMLEGQKIVF
jgi:PKD repeat protein